MTRKVECCECGTPTDNLSAICDGCAGLYSEELYDDFDDGTDCANCGGEGYVYGCSWDWQCDTYDEGEGTCLCTQRCDWCNPAKPTDAEREQLRQVLADALSPTEAPHD